MEPAPFSVWSAFLPNQSDAHAVSALHALRRRRRERVGFFFTGLPYYDVHFVDALFAVGEGASEAAGDACQVALAGVQHRGVQLTSSFGFGLLGLSAFLKQLLQAKHSSDRLQPARPKLNVCIAINR